MTPDELFRQLLNESDDRAAALERVHAALRDGGLLPKVTVHRYLCQKRSCVIAAVFQLNGLTLCAVRDYKLSPGLNEAQSVPAARRKNTHDGDRHWRARVLDVGELAEFGSSGIDMTCRHVRRTLLAKDILAASANVRPGHPAAPTLL